MDFKEGTEKETRPFVATNKTQMMDGLEKLGYKITADNDNSYMRLRFYKKGDVFITFTSIKKGSLKHPIEISKHVDGKGVPMSIPEVIACASIVQEINCEGSI